MVLTCLCSIDIEQESCLYIEAGIIIAVLAEIYNCDLIFEKEHFLDK